MPLIQNLDVFQYTQLFTAGQPWFDAIVLSNPNPDRARLIPQMRTKKGFDTRKGEGSRRQRLSKNGETLSFPYMRE